MARADVHGAAPSAPDDDGWGPEVRRSGGRRLGRLVRVALIVILVLLLALPWLASNRIPRVEVDGLAASGQPMHVLITGSDSREGLSREEMVELSTGFDDGGGQRTDTIMIMTIQGGEVALLSFPRDLWVERCDGSMGRINVAISIGGPSCVVDTVRSLSGIDIQHYVGVSFGGFRDVVDAVDGVEVCLDEPIADRDAGIDLPAGCQVLDGADALGYVRVRKIDDDLMRVQRQQSFLQALAREVATPSVLFNPLRVWQLSGSVGGAVEVNEGLGPVGLGRMALGGRGLATGNVATYTVPTTPRTTSGGAAVLDPVAAEAESLFAAFRSGAVLDEARAAGAQDEPPAVDPGEVQVQVLNGAEVDGLAGRVADDLAARGYQVTGIGNDQPRDTTLVRHPSGLRDHADRVARDLPGSPSVEESTELEVVTVTLGRDAGDRS